jgi:NitT/TauT family transport system permease protein
LPGITRRELAPSPALPPTTGEAHAPARRPWYAWLVSDAALIVYAFLGLLLVWSLVHEVRDFVPTPIDVARDFPAFLSDQDVVGATWTTLQRVIIGMAIGFAAALLAVAASAGRRTASTVINTYVFLTLSLPSIATSLIGLMVFGLSGVGVIAVVAVETFPFIAIGLSSAIRAVDPRLGEMASVYKLSFWQQLRHVTIPQITPALMSAVRNAHALAWKIAIIAEIVLDQAGIGKEFSDAFDYFQLNEVIGWLLVFIIVYMTLEYGILRALEKRLYRWHGKAA